MIRKRIPSPAAPFLNKMIDRMVLIGHGLDVVARPMHFAAHSIHLMGINLLVKIV